MTLTNWTKLVVAVTTILSVTVLLATHSISEAAGVPLITLVLGYMLGNGVAARKGEAVEPIIGPRDAGQMECGQLFTVVLVLALMVAAVVLLAPWLALFSL